MPFSIPQGSELCRNLFDASNAGSSQAKVVWPGSLTVTLPAVRSGSVANILSGGNVVGGMFAPMDRWGAVLLDFLGVGNADRSPTIEIGRFQASGRLVRTLAAVTLKSVTTSGTIANLDPFTAEAFSSVTFRYFDLATITAHGSLGQVLAGLEGAENERPNQLVVDVSEAAYYYVLLTGLDTMTRMRCNLTPTE